LQRIVGILVAAAMAVYVGDWVIYKMRGSPQSKVTVRRYATIPLKGNKSEFDFLGSIDVACSISIFAQDGESPCWQLRRNPSQNTRM
jgi:hypothetical protein